MIVSPSTTTRWISQNGLGYKLEGKKGQWIVDLELFDEFLEGLADSDEAVTI